MAGKGNKKRNSKDSTGSKEKKKGAKKNGRSNVASNSIKSSKIQGDIFSDGAMENAYLICHNVQVCFKYFRFVKENDVPTNKSIFLGCFESARFSMARSKKEKGKTKIDDSFLNLKNTIVFISMM